MHKEFQEINGFKTMTAFNCAIGYYCAYVLEYIGTDEQVKKFMDKLQSEECYDYSDYLSYHPHGGYTANIGIDCSHYGDIAIIAKYISGINDDFDMYEKRPTFKTKEFVLEELKKMTQDILDSAVVGSVNNL